MIKNLKKAFTIIELVIVIAVIAILAAVMIPTYSSLVEKANVSADEQAVSQMNKQLAIIEVDNKPETIADAVKALDKVDINLDDYSPLAKNTQFYWIKSINRVIYVDLSENKVIYPENYAKYLNENGDKYSLNGDIEFVDYTIGSGNTVSISKGGQLAKLIDDVNNGNTEATTVKKITLSNDIDLEGATCKFKASGTKGVNGFSKTIEINGNGYTIYGFRDDTQTFFGTGDYVDKGYGYGLFGNIGTSGKVTIENINFSGITVEDTINSEAGTAGLIAGYNYGTLTMKNVKFYNCSVTANQKVGAIVGQLHGTLNMDNVEFENTKVSGGCEVAKIAGIAYGNLTVDNCDFEGISTISLIENTFTSSAFTVEFEGTVLSLKGDSNNTFKYNPEWKNSEGVRNSTYDGIYNVTTNDWAWYKISSVTTGWSSAGTTSYNGRSGLWLNGTSYSASKNFTNGKPVTD